MVAMFDLAANFTTMRQPPHRQWIFFWPDQLGTNVLKNALATYSKLLKKILEQL